MNRLLPCPSCSRHVRVTETECRFCNAELDFSSAAELVLPKSRLGRAATFTFGATLVGATTLLACGETEDDKDSAGGAAGANVGAQSAGGSSAKGGSGGTTAQGGSSAQGGSAGKGGSSASGGSTAQGGTAQGGSAQGGTAGQGGRSQAGSGGTIAPPYGIPPQDD